MTNERVSGEIVSTSDLFAGFHNGDCTANFGVSLRGKSLKTLRLRSQRASQPLGYFSLTYHSCECISSEGNRHTSQEQMLLYTRDFRHSSSQFLGFRIT
jgi:hypothetical protein